MSLEFTHRSVWRIALPMVLSNITVPLLGLVDTFVVGHLPSPDYLGAVAVGSTIFSVLFLGMNFLRMGTTGLAAHAFGKEDSEELRRVLMRALTLAVVIALALIALQHPTLLAALAVIKPDAAISLIASDYFQVRIWAAPASLMNIVLIGWFIGRQDGRTPLVLMLIINLINIALDFLFVMHYDLRASGVALASVIAEYSGCIAGLWLALRSLRSKSHGLMEGVLVVSRFRELMQVNLDLLIRTLALQLTFVIITAAGARQGALILAANAVLLNFQWIVSYALDGFANAAEAMVGRAVGAKQARALDQAVRLNRAWSLLIAAGMTVIFVLAGNTLIDRITNIEEVRELARVYLPWLIALPLISVWSFLYDGVFVGAMRSKEMRNIMVLSTFVIFIPAWWLFGFMGNHGLWLAFALFMASRGLLMHWQWRRAPG
ncbi:MAG: MATE family efflux transporter [Gammaproteobacteria bacterium]